MKDAMGHGSNKRGMQTANRSNAGNHQAGVLSIGRGYRMQQAVPSRSAWQTTAVTRNITVAEHAAKHMRADNRNYAIPTSRVTGIPSGERR